MEAFDHTVKVVSEPTLEGTVKEVTVKKRKVSRRKGSKDHIFEITETTSEDRPTAEVTVVELSSDEVLDSEEKPKHERKMVKKPKQLKKDDVEEYIINIIEEFIQPIPVGLVEDEVEKVQKEETKKPKKSPITYIATEQEDNDNNYDALVKEDLDQPIERTLEQPSSPLEYTISVEEDSVGEEEKQPKPKKISKPKSIKQPSVDKSPDYLVNVISEESIIDEPIPEDYVVTEAAGDKPSEEPTFKVEELETEAVEKEVTDDDKGETTKQSVTKRKIKKLVGPKEEIIEIVETKTGDTPEYEVIVTTEEVQEKSKEAPEEKKAKTVRKAKKIPKDDLQDYIQKLIEQDIPKTELEKYEKIDLDEPVKMKRKPIKKVKQSEEQPKEETEEPIEDKPVEKISEYSEVDSDEPKLTVAVKEFIPEKPEEKPFEIVVLEETVESKREPDEEGKVREKVVKTKKIKQNRGSIEVVHDIVEEIDTDTNESVITVTTTVPTETPDQDQPSVKQKRTKKIKKDEVEDFVKRVIEEEAPQPEGPVDLVAIEDFVPKPSSEKRKKKPIKDKHTSVEEETPHEDEVLLIESVPEDSPVSDDLITVVDSVPIEEEPENKVNQIEDTKTREEKETKAFS